MKKEKNLVLQTIFILFGTIIGAGFASGKEIQTFFAHYGKLTPLFIIISCIFLYVGLKTFLLSSKLKENKWFKSLFDISIVISEILIITTMISGLFSLSELFLSSRIIVYILLVITFFIMIVGMSGLSLINIILCPLMILMIIVLTIKSFGSPFIQSAYNPVNSDVFNYISSPFLYAGLNLFSCLIICKELGKSTTKKQATIISLVVSITLLTLLLLIALSVFRANEQIFYADMPLVNLSLQLMPNCSLLFFFVVMSCIFTTLLSSCVVIMIYLKKLPIYKPASALTVLVACYYFSFLGFGNNVEKFYPPIGILGMIVTIYIYVLYIKNARQNSPCTLKKIKTNQ